MKNMVSNLKATVKVAERIAQGDLTAEVASLSDKDTLGKSLAFMVTRLREIVIEVQTAADNVAGAARN